MLATTAASSRAGGSNNSSLTRTYTTKRPQLTQEQRQELTEAFSLFDADKKGVIDLHELKVLMQALGFQVKKQQVVAMVKEVDPQNEGMVSFEQFLDMMTEQYARRDPEEEIKKVCVCVCVAGVGFEEVLEA